MDEKNSLETIAQTEHEKIHWRWLSTIALMGLLGWNIVTGVATPKFMPTKDMSFREVNQRHYETIVQKPSWYGKPIGAALHYTTYPGRVVGYYINKNI